MTYQYEEGTTYTGLSVRWKDKVNYVTRPYDGLWSTRSWVSVKIEPNRLMTKGCDRPTLCEGLRTLVYSSKILELECPFLPTSTHQTTLLVT